MIYNAPSSSPSSYSHFYVGAMYDDIRLHVAWSYTSSADSPFSLMSSFTLSNHLLLGLIYNAPTVFIILWYMVIVSMAVTLAALSSLSDSLLTIICAV